MSEESTMNEVQPAGGFAGDPAAALNVVRAGGGCCGTPAPTAQPPTEGAAAAEPCCGTKAEAQASGGCCGTAAKVDAVAAGVGCCG
jgi:hypothetical protein